MGDMPMYLKIKEHLEVLIRMNKCMPCYRLPSESQLAKQFNVSHPTVRHALLLLEQEGEIYRLQGKGSFIQNNQSAYSFPRYRVGIIIPTLEDYFIRLMVRSACHNLKERGIDAYIQFIGDDWKEEANRIYTVIREEFHGILIFPSYQSINNKAYLKLAMSNYPLVEMGRHRQGLQISSVYCNHFEQGYAAAKFFHQKGHTKIAFWGESSQSAVEYAERIRGYEYYVRNNIGSDCIRLEEVGIFLKGNNILPSEYISNLFAKYNDITAAILPSRFVPQLANYLERSKREIPEILILDELHSNVRSLLPYGLYLLSQQPFEIGRQAVEQLCGLIDGTASVKEIQIPQKIVYQPRPIIH